MSTYIEKLSDSFVAKYKNKTPPWGPIGFVVFKRTYARKVDGENRSEEWFETVARCVNGILKIGAKLTRDEAETLYDYVFNLKCSFSGRALWQLGTSTVDKLGGDSLQNCLGGETEVITYKGVATLRELCGQKDIKLLCLTDDGPRWASSTIRSFGKQKLVRVDFSRGGHVRATINHEWIKFENGRPYLQHRTKTMQLRPKRTAVPLALRRLGKMDHKGYAHGFVFGDGFRRTYEACPKRNHTCEVILFKSDEDLLPLLAQYGEVGTWTVKGKKRKYVYCLPWEWKSMPENPTKEYALGFVMGLIAADGHVRRDIRIHNKSKEVLKQVQALARFAGLHVYEPYLDRLISPFDGTEKPLYCLGISSWNLEKCYFLRHDQKEALVIKRKPKCTTIRAIGSSSEEEEVFCAQVPEFHNFVLANGVVTGNCWALAICDPVESFCFVFDELMLGGGVGFNIQREVVYEMPKVKHDVQITRRDEKDVDFIVPDNREGWVSLLRKVLTAFFYTGKPFVYSTICVRGKGALIKSFGGTASGPEDLCVGIERIVGILRQRVGKKLRPIDCLDILNIIGSIVVAGNVRRSALLALGDMDDVQFLDAKNWAKGDVPNWRSMSNNSVACNNYSHLPDKFWEGYNGDGEAYGLINLRNCRRYGRLADGAGYRPDSKVVCTNPCSEIALEGCTGRGGESCNLAEIFLPNLKDEHEFLTAAELMYKVTKTISCLSFTHEETREIVKRNHRLGIGVTGFLQAQKFHDSKLFGRTYKHVEKIDKEYSKLLGVDTSIKLTTTKPSGSLSLLPGVTPGVHPAYAPYYIRRVRMASTDPIVNACRKNGYHVEPQKNFDGTFNHDTMVVSFPVRVPEGTVCAKDLTAVKQLEWHKWLQTHWSDNSVSVTVYYKKEELPSIKQWLSENYDDHVKSVSFLLHSEHGFAQAPYEEITKEQYDAMMEKCRPITRLETDDSEAQLKDSMECTGGSCPIK